MKPSPITSLYTNFYKALNAYDKKSCLHLAMDALHTGISLSDLYENVLEKSLYDIATNTQDQKIGVWQEHVQSGIVRMVIENCYTYIQDHKAPSNGLRVLIFCPKEEYHDLGARMTADFMTLLGYDTCFIGPNTPQVEVVHAIEILKPHWLVISVTNFFHLSKIQDFVVHLKSLETRPHMKIMVGGYAIQYTPEAKEKIQADAFPYTFQDLKKIKEADHETRL